MGHQLGKAGGVTDGLGVIAGQATHFTSTGTLHHQQRNGAGGARLQHQQTVEFESAAK